MEHHMTPRRTIGGRTRLGAAVIGLAAVGALSACSTSASSSSTGTTGTTANHTGLPSTIHLYSIQDASGAAGAVGVDDENGINLAISQINAEHLLGSSTLSISYGDSATNPATAASLATAATTAHYPLVIGPPSSGTAVAVAPILSRASEPTIFTQAGGPGTLISKYMFRLTPLQTDRIPLAFKWLQSQGIKTVAVLEDSDFPTEVSLAQETAADGPQYGFKVVGTASVLAAQSNISAEVSKLLSYHAQAVALYVVLTQNATAATELKQGGFTGKMIAEDGAGNGTLDGAGSAANGIVWASDWVPGAPFGSVSAAFTKAYEAQYHTTPSDWAAESYDATFYAARAIKMADSVSPAAIDAALISEGEAGFTGVLGQAKVINGQEQATPVLVQWQNGAAVPMANQNP
jgi:branched-chain amino acid transport system substrate-binding protein